MQQVVSLKLNVEKSHQTEEGINQLKDKISGL
jgi:hypothetical protein